MDVPVLSAPLTSAEIARGLDPVGYVWGLVNIDLEEAIEGNGESWLDLCSERLIGSSLGMDISYTVVNVQSDGTLAVQVRLDPSMALDDADD